MDAVGADDEVCRRGGGVGELEADFVADVLHILFQSCFEQMA